MLCRVILRCTRCLILPREVAVVGVSCIYSVYPELYMVWNRWCRATIRVVCGPRSGHLLHLFWVRVRYRRNKYCPGRCTVCMYWGIFLLISMVAKEIYSQNFISDNGYYVNIAFPFSLSRVSWLISVRYAARDPLPAHK